MSAIDNQKLSIVIDRAKNIILQPNEEWSKIETETTSLTELLVNYVALLAAIPAVCGFLGSLLFGYSLMGISYRPSFMGALTTAITSYVMSFVGVLILGFVVDALAPTFQSTKNQAQAFKLAAYSMTAGWVAGALGIIPALAMIGGLAGLYSLYVFYLGLPKLMKTPPDKAIVYTIVVLVVVIVLSALTHLVVAGLTAGPVVVGNNTHLSSQGAVSGLTGSMQLPGGGKLDLGTLANANKTPLPAIAGDLLKNVLPETLPGGFTRNEISSSSGGQIVANTTTARAVYVNQDKNIALDIVDFAGMPQLIGFMSAFGTQSSKETADSYSKRGQVDGRVTTEEFNRTSGHGSYSVIVSNRFIVKADGNNVDIDSLKSAVDNEISPLESLAAH